jgi:hypothetical protein
VDDAGLLSRQEMRFAESGQNRNQKRDQGARHRLDHGHTSMSGAATWLRPPGDDRIHGPQLRQLRLTHRSGPRIDCAMPTRLRETLRRALALVLLAAVVFAPSAMVAGSMHSAVAIHHSGHQSIPLPHQHRPAGDCCDLCLTSCAACGGLVPKAPRTWLSPAPRPLFGPATAAIALLSLSDHQLPFALGPPAVLT